MEISSSNYQKPTENFPKKSTKPINFRINFINKIIKAQKISELFLVKEKFESYLLG